MKKVWKGIKAFFFRYRYFWGKLGISILTLIAVVILCFLLIVNMPGDVIEAFSLELASKRGITMAEARELAVKILNYDPDAPLISRFLAYVNQLLHGNFGVSIKNDAKSVNLIIKELLPYTLFVSFVALLLSFLIGTSMGIKATLRRKNPYVRGTINTYVVISSSIPDYIFALIIIMIFSFRLDLFPNAGAYDAMIQPGLSIAFIASILYYATLPVFAHVFSQSSYWEMQMNGSSIGVLGEDYIFAAQARGIPDRIIARKYIKKNAMLPLVSQLAISFGVMFGGAPLMESIFNYPGIGQAFSTSIGQRDYYVVLGILLFTSMIIIGVNLIADLLYSIIDPRVRRGV